jgi:dihydrofolate reductase
MTDRKVDITAIVAVDRNWGIGRDGNLLVHISGDLKYFKEKTLGGICIMGRKTFESLPNKPLSGRLNCVLTSDANYGEGEAWHDSIITAVSMSEILEKLNGVPSAPVFIIGGGSVYREFLPFTQTCLVTKIDAEFDADTYFPNLDISEEFRLAGEAGLCEENGVSYSFTEYRRMMKSEGFSDGK